MKEGADDGVTVLVVDDEPQIVWVLRFSLEAEGYRTVCAADGVRALEEIAQHRPRLVLLDLMMPNMDGWHVLEEMTKLPAEQRPRIVVVSALTSQGERKKVTELGADAFIAKPFDVDELLGIVNGLELVG
jgi:DNA-binding response OmpR family regulator